MQTRQNPITSILARIEDFLEGIERVFNRSNTVEPAEIARLLKREMERGKRILPGGRRLAPNLYDISVSIADHKELQLDQANHIASWKQTLIEFAHQQDFALRSEPVLRLHGKTDLKSGKVHIEAHIEDPKNFSSSVNPNGPGDPAGTAMLTPEQLAQLKAQLAAVQQPAAAPVQQGYPPNPWNSPSPSAKPMPASQAPSPGMPMPEAWLTIRLPQGGQEKYLIKKTTVSIGRQRYNDIVVEDKRVSRDHAKIIYQNGQFFIYDLGSTNGITINGVPRMRQHQLNGGDHFTIGSYDFSFQRL